MSELHVLYQPDSQYIEQNTNYHLLSLLNAFLVVAMCLCDVFVFKTISVFGYPLAVSGAIFPAISMLMIVINEVYGHKQAASSLINLIAAQMTFLTFLVIIPKIPSPPNVASDIVNAYHLVFQNEWRVFISSPVGISISLYLTSIINSLLKKFFWGKHMFFRGIFTSAITTALMVCIIYPINFIGIVDTSHIIKIIESTYIYKMIAIFFILLLFHPAIYAIKRVERKYIFDINVSYNPLKIYSSKTNGVNLYDKLHKKNN